MPWQSFESRVDFLMLKVQMSETACQVGSLTPCTKTWASSWVAAVAKCATVVVESLDSGSAIWVSWVPTWSHVTADACGCTGSGFPNSEAGRAWNIFDGSRGLLVQKFQIVECRSQQFQRNGRQEIFLVHAFKSILKKTHLIVKKYCSFYRGCW